MSVSKSTTKYILILFGVLILIASYFLVYMSFSDKTDAVNTEKIRLSQKLEQLKGYQAQAAKYQSGIDEAKASVSGTAGRYFSVVRPEDFIMFANGWEGNLGLIVNSMSFTEPVFVCSIAGVGDVKDNKAPAQALPLSGYKISSTINTQMTYSQMKQALENIAAQKDVTSLESLNISYDATTGLILGSFIVDKYYITGRNIQEHQADVPYSSIGRSVLIGS